MTPPEWGNLDFLAIRAERHPKPNRCLEISPRHATTRLACLEASFIRKACLLRSRIPSWLIQMRQPKKSWERVHIAITCERLSPTSIVTGAVGDLPPSPSHERRRQSEMGLDLPRDIISILAIDSWRKRIVDCRGWRIEVIVWQLLLRTSSCAVYNFSSIPMICKWKKPVSFKP